MVAPVRKPMCVGDDSDQQCVARPPDRKAGPPARSTLPDTRRRTQPWGPPDSVPQSGCSYVMVDVDHGADWNSVRCSYRDPDVPDRCNRAQMIRIGPQHRLTSGSRGGSEILRRPRSTPSRKEPVIQRDWRGTHRPHVQSGEPQRARRAGGQRKRISIRAAVAGEHDVPGPFSRRASADRYLLFVWVLILILPDFLREVPGLWPPPRWKCRA